MEQITVVIGDRLGKGQKVAAGVEKAGGRAVVVPGVAADMKLGDVMKAENATFGISFCGSAARALSPRKTSMATKPNMECGQWMKASPLSMRAATCWVSALWIKKSSASAWCRRGKRNTAPDDERAIHHHGESKRQGDAKARAFADALNHVQSAVMRESPYYLTAY
ncbi:Uncharacterised protein [Salmonella enterica subsp. enterica]|uniref:Uncharacterized protein n=1 Tax=Salmonella enterica I TaxID=59201 RepID=A0A447MZ39_SALET|nr:Uncharacterised protein [Salmonella enterica subsp. enterica]